MRKTDLQVGMKIAIGKRIDGEITLDGYHTSQEGTVVVRAIGKKITIEVTAKWPSLGPSMEVIESPEEIRTFELDDCRNILGPWEEIAEEYNAQVDKEEALRKLHSELESELRRLGINYSLWGQELKIPTHSHKDLLAALKSVP